MVQISGAKHNEYASQCRRFKHETRSDAEETVRRRKILGEQPRISTDILLARSLLVLTSGSKS